MTIEEVKELFPDNMTYPLPDSALDNLIDYRAIELLEVIELLECDGTKYADYVFITCTLAALIELKERRNEEEKTNAVIQRNE